MSQLQEQARIFSIKLSTEQRLFIQSLLPKGYSFQPATIQAQQIKNASLKKIAINYREDSQTEKQVHEKKRKIKSLEHLEQDQSKVNKSPIKKIDDLTRLTNVVKKLKKCEFSWPFRTPVDAKAMNIPTYNQVVLVPMDLQTIQERIKSQKYRYGSQIQRDINQMLLNSYKFNDKNSQYFEATSKLQQYYHNILSDSEQNTKKDTDRNNKQKQQPPRTANQDQQKPNQVIQFQKDLLSMLKKVNEIQNMSQRKIRQKPGYISSKHDGPISHKQRKQLLQDIKMLEQFHLGRILEIIKMFSKQNNNLRDQAMLMEDVKEREREKEEYFNIDFDRLDHRTIRQLQNYVRLQKNNVLHEKEDSVLESQDINYSYSQF